MKKILFFLLFITIYAHASIDYELRFYERIIPLIFKIPIHIYADKEIKFILRRSKKFIIENKCKDALLIIGLVKNIKCQDKPLFATDYETYKISPNAFGAFYWRKGRPQLKFKKEKLEEFNLEIDSSLQKYIK
ncbi:MAG: hypothetical protein GXO30_01565 [Epsilonproteobacteria bacterium]|nr:hypothetical protein [Campylobacterota bacterium]